MMEPRPKIRIVEDPAALAETAGHLIVDTATAAASLRGRFTIALSGGSTPRMTYTRLARPPFRDQMPWGRTWVFFGDERAVPPDHADSNYRMASEALLAKVPVPPAQIVRFRGEAGDPEVAATDYARRMTEVFGTRRGELPRFDLVLLGLGVDGHTASLFPGSPVVKEEFRTVAAVHAAAAAIPQRLTLTLPVLNAAARVVFLVAGAEKAKIVRAILCDGAALPAGLVHPPDGELIWLLDREASSLLPADAPGPGTRPPA
jgi:6-phosphogluconolactonase